MRLQQPTLGFLTPGQPSPPIWSCTTRGFAMPAHELRRVGSYPHRFHPSCARTMKTSRIFPPGYHPGVSPPAGYSLWHCPRTVTTPALAEGLAATTAPRAFQARWPPFPTSLKSLVLEGFTPVPSPGPKLFSLLHSRSEVCPDFLPPSPLALNQASDIQLTPQNN